MKDVIQIHVNKIHKIALLTPSVFFMRHYHIQMEDQAAYGVNLNIYHIQTLDQEILLQPRVSNCVTQFLKQFEARRIEAIAIGNLLTKIKEGSSSVLATI